MKIWLKGEKDPISLSLKGECYILSLKHYPSHFSDDQFASLISKKLAKKLATKLKEGWGQIDTHCWLNMTSQLITQCCRGWSNFPTCSVQQFVIMCVEQC